MRPFRPQWLKHVLGAVALLLIALWAVPQLTRSRTGEASAVRCMRNLRALHLAFELYAQDNGGRLPPSAAWHKAVSPYVTDPAAFHCPVAPGSGGYAFNSSLDSLDDAEPPWPSGRPLLFDTSDPGPAPADAVQSFAARHHGQGHVAFLDGHVRALPSAPRP